MDNKYVFLLQHAYEIDGEDEIKLIGVFSSEENAQKAIDNLKGQKGFNKFPESCFNLDKILLDDCKWQGGFISWEEAI
ncbi:MAG: SPOR domain-containing protein [Flammeovirgaceae bacterium]